MSPDMETVKEVASMDWGAIATIFASLVALLWALLGIGLVPWAMTVTSRLASIETILNQSKHGEEIDDLEKEVEKLEARVRSLELKVL